ncbi:MAG: hypothetical protein RIC95_15300 [Vicingaceae bacterium]
MKSLSIIVCFVFCLESFSQSDSLRMDSLVKTIEQSWKDFNFKDEHPDFVGSYDYLIIDQESNTSFTVDSSEILITATRKDSILWTTDPWLDNKLEIYRHNRPVITYFKLRTIKKPKRKYELKGQKFLRIGYSNSQFGDINISNGKFIFLGQD